MDTSVYHGRSVPHPAESSPLMTRARNKPCHCFCRLVHPHTAVTASCLGDAQPGLEVIKTASLVGPVTIPLCHTCFTEHTAPSNELR